VENRTVAPPPSPWPGLSESWWVYALAGVAAVVFPLSLVVGVRCGLGRCTGTLAERLFALDALGGLPRLYTTGLFVAVAVLGVLAVRRSAPPARPWWTAVAWIGGVLALAKLVSAHSTTKGLSAVGTLVVGVVLTVVALGALAVTGRRWGLAAARPVVLALGLYAAAALGLDAVTSVLVALQDGVGVLTHAAATFAEEFGEAMAALFVLVTVRWHLPARSPGAAPGSGVQDPGTGRNTPDAALSRPRSP
jgi:hypothetical protein